MPDYGCLGCGMADGEVMRPRSFPAIPRPISPSRAVLVGEAHNNFGPKPQLSLSESHKGNTFCYHENRKRR